MGLVALVAGGMLLAPVEARTQDADAFVERYRALAEETGVSDSIRLHRLFELE